MLAMLAVGAFVVATAYAAQTGADTRLRAPLAMHQGRKAAAHAVLVKPRNMAATASSAAMHDLAVGNRLRVAKRFPRTGMQRLVIEAGNNPTVSDAAQLQQVIDELRQTGLYEYVEPDYRIQASLLPTDPALNDGRLWGLLNNGQDNGVAGMDINVVDAWDLSASAADVVVAVIDSGIRATHRELRNNLWVNPGEIPDNGIDDDQNGYVDDVYGINAITESGNPYDNNGHGTHVAGTIAAAANSGGPHVGVAYNSRLMILKALEADGGGYVSDAVESIEYAIANGADIINASWGSYSNSTALRDAVSLANDAGVLFVAAAGNSSRNNDAIPNYPSSFNYPNIVAVAAINRRGQLASFSNYGNLSVDIAAPGEDIYSTLHTSNTAYGYKSGTSMATPHVSGVLALLASHFPADSHLTLKSRLMLGAQPLLALQERVVSEGIADAYASLAADADGELELEITVTDELVANRRHAVYVEVRDLFPVLDAEVTAQFDAQPQTVLRDDGSGVDAVAGDGIYSGLPLTPPDGSEVTVYVTAMAPGKTTRSMSETFPLLSPPANDDYANRILLSGPAGNTIGGNRLASAEPGEPLLGPGSGGKTVWWEWNAPDDTKVTFSTEGSDFDTKISIYTGHDDIESLLIVSLEDDSDWRRTATFTPVAGASYKIRIDGYNGETGSIALSYPAAGAPGPPVITRFYEYPEGASIREGDSYIASYYASGAGTFSYQWYFNGLPIVGQTEFVLRAIDFATVADQGNYHLVVTGELGSVQTDPIFLRVEEYGGPPDNDRHENRITLPGDSGTVYGSNIWAEEQWYDGEPANTALSAPIESVWYEFTPPADGLLELDTLGSDFDTTLGIYDGEAYFSNLRNLRPIMANDDHTGLQSRVAVNVFADRAYSISVDGYRSEEGLIQLNYRFTPGAVADRPFNDDFANAFDMTERSTFNGSTHGATAEPGEEAGFIQSSTIETVWFSWLAKRCGDVTFDTRWSRFQTILSVRQGDSVADLITLGHDMGGDATVTMSPVVGERYFIAIDGRTGDEGDYVLNVSQAADNAGCGSILGTDVAAAGTANGASRLASHTRTPGRQPRVALALANEREPRAELAFFNDAWDGIAIDSLADGNGDGTADDAVIAMLARHRDTGQIKVQLREALAGRPIRENIAFFNARWLPVDIATLPDLNGDGAHDDPAVAVLAENVTSGRIEVEVIPVHTEDGTPVFKGRFFSRDWRPVALDTYLADGQPALAVLAALPEAFKAKVQQKLLAGEESITTVFAFGNATAARDLVVLEDGNADGEPGDPALAVLGTKSDGGATSISIRDAGTGAKLDTLKPLGRGFTAERLALVADHNNNGHPEFAVSADHNDDARVLLKLRDVATTESVGEIWIGDGPPDSKD